MTTLISGIDIKEKSCTSRIYLDDDINSFIEVEQKSKAFIIEDRILGGGSGGNAPRLKTISLAGLEFLIEEIEYLLCVRDELGDEVSVVHRRETDGIRLTSLVPLDNHTAEYI